MARKSLAVKYRPQSFSEVVEQNATVVILENQIATNTFKNAILMTGPAGCGKTTSARIFAKAINGGKGNPIEIDAASNNGIDNIRDIIIKSQQKALDCEYKVFILDEVHAFSNQAWQALLKLIEEPPAKTVFVFCTTDPQKIPATILSRVQRFDFQRLTFDAVVNRLNYIIEEEKKAGENISITQEAIQYIAKLADGGMRDSITYLDKCISLDDEITLDKAVKILGGVDYTIMFELLNNIIDCKEADVIRIIESLYQQGTDLKLFIKQFTLFILDIRKYMVTGDTTYIQIPITFKEQLDSCSSISGDFVKYLLENINDLNSIIKWEHQVKSMVELKLLLLSKE